MALIAQIPPRATRKACQEGLAEMIRYHRVPKDLPKLDTPQQIYILSLQEIVQGKGIPDPKPMVWEFLIGTASGPAVAISVAHPAPGQPPRMTSVTRGSDPAEALQATRQVEKLPQVQARNYELRRLRIAGLSIGCIWLRALGAGPDLAVPSHALDQELEKMRAYPLDEFLAVVRPLAEKRLKFNDSPAQTKKKS
jgi:hypothetical protein